MLRKKIDETLKESTKVATALTRCEICFCLILFCRFFLNSEKILSPFSISFERRKSDNFIYLFIYYL